MKRVIIVTLAFTLAMVAGAGAASAAPSDAGASGVAAVENPGGQVAFDWACGTTSLDGEVYMVCANDNTGETYVEHLYTK